MKKRTKKVINVPESIAVVRKKPGPKKKPVVPDQFWQIGKTYTVYTRISDVFGTLIREPDFHIDYIVLKSHNDLKLVYLDKIIYAEKHLKK